MHSVKNILLAGGADTPLSIALDVTTNAQWLTYVMYSIPYVNINLPPLVSVKFSSINKLSADDIDALVTAISSDRSAIEQMEAKGTEEAFFLAVRSLEKLAIAAYTLYLYGNGQSTRS
jgi:hypothetical protein